MNVAPDGDRPTHNSVKHETLFHNRDVLAAGEICIQNGQIVDLNDCSASYGTYGELEATPQFADVVLSVVTQHHLPMSDLLKHDLQQLRTP
jgi:hypothetical protein